MSGGKANARGFSLVELLIAMAVLGLLVASATTSYRYALRKSNRAAAQSFLSQVAQQEQQYFIDNRSYLSCASPLVSSTCALNVTAPAEVTPYYTVSVAANNTATPMSFTVSAVPISTSFQASDPAGTLTIDNTGSKTPSTYW